MTVYEYPDYAAHAEMVAGMKNRIERMTKVLAKLQQEWDDCAIDAASGNRDVSLTVDSKGRLMSLSLAEGCTVRYDHVGLEELINATLKSAVKAARIEAADIEKDISADVVAAERNNG